MNPLPHPYLLKFTYDYYCQGYESTFEYALVYAYSFEQACNYIRLESAKYTNARDFENLNFGPGPCDL